VFISGRPLWVNPELNLSDAFVAAWLPGSEGAGVADLLFKPTDGSPRREFTGRLSFSWPATAMPVRFTASGSVEGALFARGFGLSFTHPSQLQRLDEDARVPPQLRTPDTLFHAGHVTAPWSIYVDDATAGVRLTTATQPSPRGALTVQLEPPLVRASWSGQSIGVFSIGGRASDLRARARDGAALIVRYRVDSRPQQPVRIGMVCEAPYETPTPVDSTAPPVIWTLCGTKTGAAIDMTARFASAPPGVWQTLSMPLACLTDQGADLSHVSAPFAVATSGQFAVSFDEVDISTAAGNTSCQ
jgi:beta-glucosidase